MATPLKWGSEFTIGGGLFDTQGVTFLRSGHYVVVGMKGGASFTDSIDIGGIRHENTAAAGAASYINTAKQFSQTSPEITTLANGNYVVVWNTPDATFNTDIKAQIFNPLGIKVGSEFRVNTTVAGSQQFADVTALSNGKFLVHWAINASGATQNNCQIFNADGTKSGLHFSVDSDNLGSRIVTTEMAAGGFAAVILDGFGHLQLQRFNAVGAKVGGDTRITSHSTDNTPPSGLDTLTSGKLAVTWVYYDYGPATYNVQVRLFNADGTAASSIVNAAITSSSSRLSFSDIIALKDGRSIVSWVRDEGTTLGLYGRLINADGSINGSIFKINTVAINEFAIGDWNNYDVTLLADGRVVFTWDNSSSFGPIKAQIIDPRESGVTVSGTTGVDSFVGTRFADRFISNGGADKLNGGLGNDTYVLGSSTIAIITDSGGNDTVESTISRALTSTSVFENITLLGSTNINATGNGAGNILKGNAGRNILDGGLGNDTLDPGSGGTGDSLRGGGGNDTYALGSRASGFTITDTSGIDTVTSTINRSIGGYPTIENLTLLGTGHVFAYGNASLNTITGNSGNNLLHGGADNLVDILRGGAGNDTYVLYNAVNDDIQDSSGIDTIQSALTRSLADAKYTEVERLTLTGTANINGTGNALLNLITGNSGNNVLNGGSDSNAIDDTLSGAGGNDTYVLGAGSDIVIDASGTDTITSTIERYLSNYATIENLTLLGTAGTGYGNSLNNTIIGNAVANTLKGLGGADTLTGNGGADFFVFDHWSESPVASRDIIMDFNRSEGDKISIAQMNTTDPNANGYYLFRGTGAFLTENEAELRYYVSGADLVIQGDTQGNGSVDFEIVIKNRTDLLSTDFVL